MQRVLADGVAGGLSSEMRGGKFVDGFRSNFATSALMYLNTAMRENQIKSSLASDDPAIRAMNDGTGLSAGMNGDGFKLAGGRWNSFLDESKVQCSPLGCQQNGPGSIFGIGYPKGGFVDMTLESFAGPHDFANSHWFYAANGTILQMSHTREIVLDVLTNFTTSLVFATPFAAAAVSQQTNLSAYWDDIKRRR